MIQYEEDTSALDFGGPVRYRAVRNGVVGPWAFSQENAEKLLEIEEEFLRFSIR